MTRYVTHKVTIAAIIVTIGVFLLIGNSRVGSQEPENTFNGWPPFVAVFETEGRAAVAGSGSVDTGRIKRELVWNSRSDWKVTTTEGPTVNVSGHDYSEVGSYESRNGRTYTIYDSWLDSTLTRELAANEEPIAAGMFSDVIVFANRVAARTDDRVVLLDMEYCDGECNIVGPRSSDNTYTEGRQYGEHPVIFTNDEYLIPLRSGDTEVLELHTNPPTPTPTPTPTPAPTPTPYAGGGNPRAESVTGTSVTVSWGRLGRPQSGGARDYRVNYRLPASESWTYGNHVTSESFGQSRPRTTVPRDGALQCNTQYEFQVEAQLADGWHDYGTVTASTGAC